MGFNIVITTQLLFNRGIDIRVAESSAAVTKNGYLISDHRSSHKPPVNCGGKYIHWIVKREKMSLFIGHKCLQHPLSLPPLLYMEKKKSMI